MKAGSFKTQWIHKATSQWSSCFLFFIVKAAKWFHSMTGYSPKNSIFWDCSVVKCHMHVFGHHTCRLQDRMMSLSGMSLLLSAGQYQAAFLRRSRREASWRTVGRTSRAERLCGDSSRRPVRARVEKKSAVSAAWSNTSKMQRMMSSAICKNVFIYGVCEREDSEEVMQWTRQKRRSTHSWCVCVCVCI